MKRQNPIKVYEGDRVKRIKEGDFGVVVSIKTVIHDGERCQRYDVRIGNEIFKCYDYEVALPIEVVKARSK